MIRFLMKATQGRKESHHGREGVVVQRDGLLCTGTLFLSSLDSVWAQCTLRLSLLPHLKHTGGPSQIDPSICILSNCKIYQVDENSHYKRLI